MLFADAGVILVIFHLKQISKKLVVVNTKPVYGTFGATEVVAQEISNYLNGLLHASVKLLDVD